MEATKHIKEGEVIGHSIRFVEASTRPYYNKKGLKVGQISLPSKLMCIISVEIDNKKINAIVHELEVAFDNKEAITTECKKEVYNKLMQKYPITSIVKIQITTFANKDWQKHEIVE